MSRPGVAVAKGSHAGDIARGEWNDLHVGGKVPIPHLSPSPKQLEGRGRRLDGKKERKVLALVDGMQGVHERVRLGGAEAVGVDAVGVVGEAAEKVLRDGSYVGSNVDKAPSPIFGGPSPNDFTKRHEHLGVRGTEGEVHLAAHDEEAVDFAVGEDARKPAAGAGRPRRRRR